MIELSPEITSILNDWADGNSAALDRLMPLVFDELRGIARVQLSREAKNHTLQPTALVNEVYLRLLGKRTVTWRSRAHFFGSAAQLMRKVLIDHARRRLASKRGPDIPRISIESNGDVEDHRAIDLIALDDALRDLDRLDPRQSRIVELRFFTGLSEREISEVLQVSERTIRRDWRTARLLLSELLNAS